MNLRGALAAVVLAGAVFAPGASHAVGTPILAGPGSYLPTSSYTTPIVVWTAVGTGLQFVNADIEAHDVVSEATRAPGTATYCPAPGPRCPLFRTDQIGPGEVAEVQGLHDITPGSYLFRCTPHPWMEATLVVL